MHDIALSIFLLISIGLVFRVPYIGLLLWALLSIMNPHQLTFGFARSVPWNLVVVIVTVIAWSVSSERKALSAGPTTALVFLLIAWSTLASFYAFDPSYSWPYWNRAWKTVAMGYFAGIMTTSMVRFQALIWVVALSLGYYGVKGGVFTLISGGASHVYGPPNSYIYDNNMLADALVMLLPILNYLRLHSSNYYIRIGIVLSIILTLASIFGSYSRESYIALAVISVAFWFRAKNKLIYPIFLAVVVIPLLYLMPESIFHRMASIQDYNTDSSFQARLDSWWVAYRYAMDHFPLGAGFYGMNLQSVWDQYIPGEMHAAHSIYFQILGEQGAIGLLLYSLIIASGFINFANARRDTTGVAEYSWLRDLATMMQLSLLAFCVAGAAAPIDFFDLFFLWVLLSARLRKMARDAVTRPDETARVGTPANDLPGLVPTRLGAHSVRLR
jgi:probable O-glycosylation ligase (exosortase A-associated)